MFICQTCHGYVNNNRSSSHNQEEPSSSLPTITLAEESTIQKEAASQQIHQQTQHQKQQQERKICSICLGFWSTSSSSDSAFGFAQRLEQAIKQAVQPYHDFSTTAAATTTTRCLFSRRVSQPRMNLPGDFITRLVEAQKKKNGSNNLASNIVTDFAQDLKLHAKTLLEDCLNRLENCNHYSNDDDDEYPPCIKEEEQGYLAIYVIVLPAHHISRPSCVAMANKNGSKKSRKRQQQQQQSHGNQEGFVQQGGDPYLNLENKLQAAQGNHAVIWTMNQALNNLSNDGNGDNGGDDDADFFNQPIHATMLNKSNGENGSNNNMNDHDHATTPALDIHVAVWRRPFYLQSMYTKTCRDVSQTPFYVVDSINVDDTDDKNINDDNDDDNEESTTTTTTTTTTVQSSTKRRKTQRVRRKLGATSVEEEILPTITKYTGGISTLNNVHDGSIVNSNNMTIQFGMAKFHASGREDMDVRMLLPSTEHTSSTKDNITGRPFVCEMIDAYRLPPMSSLSLIVNEINHTTTTTTAALPLQEAVKDIDDESTMIRAYGKNPVGVGIAPCLKFVPSSSFKNLQAMTESKVKYYCCLCWSEKPLSSFLDNTNGKEASTLDEILGSFPTEIQQRTPLRVLHRRPNIIRLRHVLTCRATPIDEHHFRLHLSTDAGTYVKEFVHGDLGRTIPSVGSLLGCKADILQLDCEGIQSHFDE